MAKKLDNEVTFTKDKLDSFACFDSRINDLGWEFCTIGNKHRDSDLLTLSNYEVIKAELAKLDPDCESHGYMRASHWAVGWYEHLIVDPTNEKIIQELRAFDCAISDYPVLDEIHLSNLEIEEMFKAWDSYGRSEFKKALVSKGYEQFDDCDDDALDQLWHDLYSAHGIQDYSIEGDSVHFYTDEVVATYCKDNPLDE